MPQQQQLTASMRAILVDWLIEVQQNFELHHETLYSAVALTDLYLARKPVSKDKLQLLGATALLIASKFEVCISIYFIHGLFYLDLFNLTVVVLPV